MLQKVLFASDGSECARAAGRLLARLSLPEGTAIHTVTVLEPWVTSLLERFQEGQRHRGHLILNEAANEVRSAHATVTVELRTGDVAHEILSAAREFGADLIVIGSRGLTGLDGILLGSVSRNVASHAPCSVLVARPPQNEFRQVVIAMDASDHAATALEVAASLPLPERSAFTVVSVVQPYYLAPEPIGIDTAAFSNAVMEIREQQREAANEVLVSARQRLEEVGRQASLAPCEGDPAREILRVAAEQQADLIVAGARGVSRLEGLFLGSVADRLLKSASCSVLIAR
jgi:nucleotide-binding universal stress UspA family protein